MAGKADFTEDEWKALQQGVMGAGMLVSVAHRDFTDSFGEAKAIAADLASHADDESQLIRELAETPRHRVRRLRVAEGSPGGDVRGARGGARGARGEGSRRAGRLPGARARGRERGSRGEGWRRGRGDSRDREDHGRARGRLAATRHRVAGARRADVEISDFTMKAFQLGGKNAVVTGGNTGLGQAFALALARAARTSSSRASSPTTAPPRALIEAEGVRYEFTEADITQPGVPKSVVEACVERLGSIDILVNSAGICPLARRARLRPREVGRRPSPSTSPPRSR